MPDQTFPPTWTAPHFKHEWRTRTSTSLMLPRAIHQQYDAKELAIEPLTDRGADGPLRISYGGRSYEER